MERADGRVVGDMPGGRHLAPGGARAVRAGLSAQQLCCVLKNCARDLETVAQSGP